MKRLFLLAIASLSISAFAIYEDDADVQAMVAAGQPTIDWNSDKCPGRIASDKRGIHQLGSERQYLCVKHVAPPKAVLSEIAQMDEDQLENESDYDQRITKVYVFETRRSSDEDVNSYLLRILRKALNIPEDMAQNFSIRSGVMAEHNISSFGGLAIGDDWYDDWDQKSATFEFLKKEILGKKAVQVIYEDGKSLYPGGGINVRFHLFFFDEKIVYVKHVGWDA